MTRPDRFLTKFFDEQGFRTKICRYSDGSNENLSGLYSKMRIAGQLELGMAIK
jgi:hypothetical protein